VEYVGETLNNLDAEPGLRPRLRWFRAQNCVTCAHLNQGNPRRPRRERQLFGSEPASSRDTSVYHNVVNY